MKTKIAFSKAALKCIEEAGIDPAVDLERLREGTTNRRELLESCLDGADPDRIQGWNDYVNALVVASLAHESEQNNPTFDEWLAAAGRSDSASEHDLRAAWRAGEDPEEYRV